MRKLRTIFVLLLVLAVVCAKKKSSSSTAGQSRQKLLDEMQQNQGTHEVTVEITRENFEQLKAESKYLMALLVTSDRSSIKLLSDYPQLHHNLKENGIEDFVLGLVDHEEWTDLAKNEGVKKVPALILYSEYGQQKDIYKGLNYVEDMFNWIYKTIKSPRTHSISIPNFENLAFRIKQFDIFAVFFGTKPNTPEFQAFEQLAAKKKDLVFAHTFDKECREENGYKDPELQGIVLYNKREEELHMNYINHYKGDLLNMNEFKQFLKVFSTPAIQMVRPWDTNKIFEGPHSNLILALDQQDYFQQKESPEDLMTPEELAFLDLRPKLLKQVFLNILNVTDRNREEVSNAFNLDKNFTLPQVFYVQPLKQKPARKYIFQGDKINVQTMLKFVQDIKKERIKPIGGSEKPIPKEKLDTMLVKSVVSENWDEYVIKNNQQDVLVFYYSLGCYTCDDLKPMYYNLAYRLRHNPHLSLVRINIQENDVPVSVKKTPEFQLFKANMKDSPVNFIYTNKQSALLEALKQAVSFPWVKPVPENEVNQKEIVIDETELEYQYRKDAKKREEEQKKKSREEMISHGINPDDYEKKEEAAAPVKEEQQKSEDVPEQKTEGKQDL